MLPFAAMFGYSVSVIHIYGINPYIIPVTTEFGWSRAQFTGAFTFAILIQALLAVPVGMMVDRFGSRKAGAGGHRPGLPGFTTLGTATGESGQLVSALGADHACRIAGAGNGLDQRRRHALYRVARAGLCHTLCGASIAQFAFPPLATPADR